MRRALAPKVEGVAGPMVAGDLVAGDLVVVGLVGEEDAEGIKRLKATTYFVNFSTTEVSICLSGMFQ